MPGRFGVPVLIALVMLSTRVAGAETAPLGLAVHRQPGAERCPDQVAVERELQAVFPEVAEQVVVAPADAQLLVEVTISAVPDGYEATIAFSGTRTGQRRIVDESEDCGGLAKALAVAVATAHIV